MLHMNVVALAFMERLKKGVARKEQLEIIKIDFYLLENLT
jgi:hypothetical protein